jgi:hypothetical protein
MGGLMDINELSKDIYADNVAAGWWDDPDRDPLVVLQLISTEIAEATEGERKSLMDDHLPHRRMGEVELADALIRTLDFGGRYEVKYVGGRRPGRAGVIKLISKAKSIAECHYYINETLFSFGHAQSTWPNKSPVAKIWYSRLVDLILETGAKAGYQIETAMAEKRAYNKTRADHTREARAAGNGKKF